MAKSDAPNAYSSRLDDARAFSTAAENKEYDWFKDSPVRYLAFANDVGEVLRSVVGNKVANLSWLITGLYSGLDVLASSHRVHKASGDWSLVKAEFKDAALWQLFASVLITPLMLKSKCLALEAVTQRLISANNKSTVVKFARNYGPHTFTIVVGIPVVVPYGDQLVDDIMDKYYRQTPRLRDHLSHNLLWSRFVHRYPNLMPRYWI